MTRSIRSMLTTAIGTLLWMVAPADAEDRTFNKPRYEDARLDWCLQWGTHCGQPAADTFCNRRRFTRARVFRAEVVGRSEPTRLFGSYRVCRNEPYCTAFAYITCEDPIPSNRIFINPAWQGKRLDVCLQWAANCGKPAADAFCKSKHFAESFAWFPDAKPGYAPTKIISSGQLCNEAFCTGFQQIICK
jgi:hypothetical protein